MFWCHRMEWYPRITIFTLEVLLFVTAYLCERAFSILVEVKTQNGTGL